MGAEPKLIPRDISIGSVQDARGWPMLALWCEWDCGPEFELGSALGAIELTPSLPNRRDVSSARALPLRPIWSGLIVDTLAFAIVWFIVISCAGFIARQVRALRPRLAPA